MIPVIFDIIPPIVLLFSAGLVAGAVNAIAGGGTFLTFPALIAAGLPPFVANASNFVALVPGNAVALLPLRKALPSAVRQFPFLIALAIFGGLLGSMALLHTGPTYFSALVPWMMLLATSLYAFTEPTIRLIRRSFPAPSPAMRKSAPVLLGIATMAVAFYCGYFGAGVGFLFLSVLAFSGIDDMVTCQAVKNLSLTIITIIGILLYGLADAISWPEALTAFSGAVIGGWFGGAMILRIRAAVLRYVILSIGCFLTAGFFLFPPGN